MRKVRTADRRVPYESKGIAKAMTVRATETSRCSSNRHRVKRAILPAATDELHHNGHDPFFGDKASGIREMTTA